MVSGATKRICRCHLDLKNKHIHLERRQIKMKGWTLLPQKFNQQKENSAVAESSNILY